MVEDGRSMKELQVKGQLGMNDVDKEKVEVV